MRYSSFSPLVLLLLTTILLTSCGKFAKLQKKGTDDEKYEAALKYYKEGDYYHAGILFEELIPLLKGGDKAELAQFYHAYTQFNQGLYNMSQFQFKRFYETYARSEKAQEAYFMHAYSLYKDSAPHSLDQGSTLTAITAMQDFINTYPESAFRNECTRYILELRGKLERKAYEKASLYYKISDFNIASLKSAVISIDNFQKDFPDSEYNEELSYLRVDAQYNLAKTSFASKQKERYQDVVKYYEKFIDKYPSSKMAKDAEKLYATSLKELEQIAKAEKERLEKQAKPAEPENKPTKVTTGTSAKE